MTEPAMPPPPTEVFCRTDTDPLRVVPVGDIDLIARDQLEAALATVAGLPPVDVVVDLGRTTFLDSTGLGFLVRLHKLVAERGRTLCLLHPRGAVARALELSGLDRVLTISQL
jgi:anti-sigma B factor antagonist